MCLCFLCNKQESLTQNLDDYSRLLYSIDAKVIDDSKLNLIISHNSNKTKSTKKVLSTILTFFNKKISLNSNELKDLNLSLRDYDYMIHKLSMIYHELGHFYPHSYKHENYYLEIQNSISRMTDMQGRMAYLGVTVLLLNNREKNHLFDDDSDLFRKRFLEFFFNDFTVADVESGNCSVTLTVNELNDFLNTLIEMYRKNKH